MIGWELLGLAAILWVAKQMIGPLIGQQMKGSVPDYTASKARAAARLLPSELAEQYEQDWLAELDALADKPVSAILYARGLRRAARRIAAQMPGFEWRSLSLPVVESLRRYMPTGEQRETLAVRILLAILLLIAGGLIFSALSLVLRLGGNEAGSMDLLSLIGGSVATVGLLLTIPVLTQRARQRARELREKKPL